MSEFIVMKFGGSSQCLQGMNVILKNIEEYVKNNKKIILVVSAVGKTTNNLYGIVNFVQGSFELIYSAHKTLCESIQIDFKIIEDLLEKLQEDIQNYKSSPFVDYLQLKLKIISWGEILSSKIVWLFLQKNNIPIEYLSAHNFIKNNNVSTNIDQDTLNLKGEFYCDKNVLTNMINSTNSNIFITQGFIATTSDNKYCILTRSGSNTSASLIANAVNAEKLVIYTDVSGMYTGDPRKIKNTKVIQSVKYDVSLEASSMGTNLIHPFSIRPCSEKNIPIYIKNTFDPESNGTVITNSSNFTDNTVYLISVQNNVTIFKIYSLDMSEGYGFMADIFDVFGKEKIDVGIVNTSQFEVTATTNEKINLKIERTKNILSEKYQVEVIQNCAIVSIVAENVLHNLKIDNARRIVLEHQIKPIYISNPSSNKLTWSFVVDDSISEYLSNLLHDKLIIENFEDNIKSNKNNKTKKRKINKLNFLDDLDDLDDLDNSNENPKKISKC